MSYAVKDAVYMHAGAANNKRKEEIMSTQN
jgi:hypothetical protein